MNNVLINSNNKEQIVNNAINIFNSLSNEKMNEAYDFLSYLNDKEEWEATRELESPEILNAISVGLNDFRNGDFTKLSDIRKNV